MNTHRFTRPTPALLALGLLVLGACGGDDGSADEVASLGSAPSSDGSSDGETQQGGSEGNSESPVLGYAQCMRDNGVDMPDPDLSDPSKAINLGDSHGAAPDVFEQAQEACSDILEAMTGGDAGGGGGVSEEQKEAILDFTQCMRDEGIDMPDPDFASGGMRVGASDLADQPGFEEAQAACESELTEGAGPTAAERP